MHTYKEILKLVVNTIETVYEIQSDLHLRIVSTDGDISRSELYMIEKSGLRHAAKYLMPDVAPLVNVHPITAQFANEPTYVLSRNLLAEFEENGFNPERCYYIHSGAETLVSYSSQLPIPQKFELTNFVYDEEDMFELAKERYTKEELTVISKLPGITSLDLSDGLSLPSNNHVETFEIFAIYVEPTEEQMKKAWEVCRSINYFEQTTALEDVFNPYDVVGHQHNIIGLNERLKRLPFTL